jgi:HAD superfamily hydrolase (TIGR01484 family)
MKLPRPLAELPQAALRTACGVFTDIDDTLTRDGAIEAVALHALQQLARHSVPVIAITGRPLGWSRPFALAWPVAAIVAENGAVALIRDGDTLRTEYAQDEPTRELNGRRLQAVADRLRRELPMACLARDSAGRVTDIAVDHSEFVHLPPQDIARVVHLMREEGMNATVSSIHINGWYGEHTKLSAAHWMVRRLFGRELRAEMERWLYIGDSTNDQLMFEAFDLSVGVANLRRFADELSVWPAYLTDGERGQGVAELTSALLAARKRSPTSPGKR